MWFLNCPRFIENCPWFTANPREPGAIFQTKLPLVQRCLFPSLVSSLHVEQIFAELQTKTWRKNDQKSCACYCVLVYMHNVHFGMWPQVTSYTLLYEIWLVLLTNDLCALIICASTSLVRGTLTYFCTIWSQCNSPYVYELG